jgi:hypothetical protein
MPMPTLSFLYQAGGLTAARPFAVTIDSGSGPVTVYTTTLATNHWTHRWVDLSAWAGQAVTVSLGIETAAGQQTTFAYIDEVSLGAAHSDTWVTLDGIPVARSGALVTYTLHYGNRGAVPIGSQALTLELDPQLQFVSANPPAGGAGQTLSWTTGSMPAGSDSGPVIVTARVRRGMSQSLINSTAHLAAPAAEIETGNNLANFATQIAWRLFLALLART